ncbi:MAG: hypothetical protein GY950_35400 [bacterium]|nr:hypothetical protein [bacterium]
MNKDKLRNILILLLAVFFSLQLLSRFVSSLGSRTGSPGLFKVSAVCFPFESDPYFRYGITQSKNRTEESVSVLKTSLSRNPFLHRAHFHLGQNYLSQSPPSEERIKKGIAALVRAIRLQGGRDIEISRRALQLMLTHWGRLADKEKRLCRKLLKNIIRKIGETNFAVLLETWETSARDLTFFDGVLEEAPQYYNITAQALARLEMDMELRRLFKLNHEIYTLKQVRKQYKKLSNRSPDLPSRLTALRDRLKQEITGYHKIVRGSKFNTRNYRDLLKRLDFQILYCLQQREEMGDFIMSCIEDFSDGEDLEELNRFLSRQGFFEARDFRSNYIRGRIHFKRRDYAAVTSCLAQLEYSVSSTAGGTGVDSGDGNDYIPALLLLSDAYIASRLLTKALSVLRKVETLCSPPSPHLLELQRQQMKIEHMIGPDTVEDPQRAGYSLLLNQSRRIEPTRLSYETTVFLVKNSEIEIRLDALEEKIKNRHLLQVFVNGGILYEVYLSRLEPNQPIKIRIFPFEKFSKHKINVKII